jgi:hypothetical protein
MAAVETAGNGTETLRYEDEVLRRLDHLDALLHSLDQRVAGMQEFIDEHRPALARGLSLMDPGAAARKFMGLPAKKARDAKD